MTLFVWLRSGDLGRDHGRRLDLPLAALLGDLPEHVLEGNLVRVLDLEFEAWCPDG